MVTTEVKISVLNGTDAEDIWRPSHKDHLHLKIVLALYLLAAKLSVLCSLYFNS